MIQKKNIKNALNSFEARRVKLHVKNFTPLIFGRLRGETERLLIA